MTSATFNSSGKGFIEIHLLIQFLIGIKISFLGNLIMAGDISPLELHLKTMSAETNSKRIPKFIFDCYDIWVIAKVLSFFSTI